MTISRNAPCTCGSGKKYKKCCLGKEITTIGNKVKGSKTLESANKKDLPNPFLETDIDTLSNSVLDLIKSKDFEKAKEICCKLQDEYPDQVDGIERLAAIYEAEGNVEKAAENYRKAVEFMKINPGFDDEGIQWYLEKAAKLEGKGK